MMEKVDSTAVVKKLNTGTERKDLMVLKIDSICNWEQFVMPAPTSIAILGQLMAIATKKDFSLDKQIPVGGFKFVKYPNSFRACLVQISNSGCEAFMEAHKIMNKIRMYTMQFQQSIRHIVDTLNNGSDEERTENLPGMFEELRNDANECLNLAKATENKFHYVMLLIDETSESSAAVKGVNEDDRMAALEKMKALQKEENLIEKRKKEMEDERKRVIAMIEELEKAKSSFDKSLEDVPGMGKLLLIKTVEEGLKITTGALNLFGQNQMMPIATGLTALASVCKGTIQETLKQSNKPDFTTARDNQRQPNLLAYQHAYKIHVFIEKMYEMFQKNTDSKEEKKVDLDDHERALNEIKDALVTIKENYKRSEFANDSVVLEATTICKKGIELCQEMLLIDKKIADELFQKVVKLKSKSKTFQIEAQVFFKYSPPSIPSSEKRLSDQISQSKKIIETASENARYEVELTKKELDDDNLSHLKAQWSCLVLFFQNITCEIDICLSQKTNNIVRRLRDGRYSVFHSTRDLVLEMAASVNSVAYAVELVATAYTDISKKHLVPNIASLGELIAYDPVTEGEQLNRKRRQIDEDCKEAKAEIQALAEKSRKDLDKKIDDMYGRLEEQVNKLPSLLPQAKVKEIMQNSDMSAAVFNDLGF